MKLSSIFITNFPSKGPARRKVSSLMFNSHSKTLQLMEIDWPRLKQNFRMLVWENFALIQDQL